MNAIQEAVFQHVAQEVERAPDVIDAWRAFREAYTAVEAVLKPADQVALCLNLEETVNYAVNEAVNYAVNEAVRAAFLEGLAFDAKALLLDAAREG